MPLFTAPSASSLNEFGITTHVDWAGSNRGNEWDRRQDSEPAIVPSLLFTEEEAASVNWDAVFAQW